VKTKQNARRKLRQAQGFEPSADARGEGISFDELGHQVLALARSVLT
jgi:hypothetical protein